MKTRTLVFNWKFEDLNSKIRIQHVLNWLSKKSIEIAVIHFPTCVSLLWKLFRLSIMRSLNAYKKNHFSHGNRFESCNCYYKILMNMVYKVRQKSSSNNQFVWAFLFTVRVLCFKLCFFSFLIISFHTVATLIGQPGKNDKHLWVRATLLVDRVVFVKIFLKCFSQILVNTPSP